MPQSIPAVWIGAGGMAGNLARALQPLCQPVQIISRSMESATALASQFPGCIASADLSEILPQAQLIFITTPDAAVAEVAARLAVYVPADALVVHTAGSVPLSALAALPCAIGVFYPLQTVSRARQASFAGASVLLEGSPAVLARLHPLVGQLGGRVVEASSDTRAQVHLGAVFMSNFVNHLARTAEEIATQAGIESAAARQLYLPLLHETVDKLHTLPPAKAQTGPARRGDLPVLQAHQLLLASQPEALALYQLFTRQLLALYHPGLAL